MSAKAPKPQYKVTNEVFSLVYDFENDNFIGNRENRSTSGWRGFYDGIDDVDGLAGTASRVITKFARSTLKSGSVYAKHGQAGKGICPVKLNFTLKKPFRKDSAEYIFQLSLKNENNCCCDEETKNDEEPKKDETPKTSSALKSNAVLNTADGEIVDVEIIKEKPATIITLSSILRRYAAYEKCEEAKIVHRYLQLRKFVGSNIAGDDAEVEPNQEKQLEQAEPVIDEQVDELKDIEDSQLVQVTADAGDKVESKVIGEQVDDLEVIEDSQLVQVTEDSQPKHAADVGDKVEPKVIVIRNEQCVAPLTNKRLLNAHQTLFGFIPTKKIKREMIDEAAELAKNKNPVRQSQINAKISLKSSFSKK